MSSNEGQVRAKDDEEIDPSESPTEKLEGRHQPGSPIPGAQNPESIEIKKEVNPNTE
ncbi:MAG TPA: hypothetical protein VK619_04140 [Pyrinomonadaceae bacterium]|nr:hypothetical protein [Pyrinomonadaceae bacterium]